MALTTTAAQARTRPHYGGTLHIEVEADPLGQGGVAERLILDGLTQASPDGQIRPALATRWASENNDHRWQFWLRPGVQFHNSHPFNAVAVAAALEDSCRANAASPCPWTAIRIAGQTIVITSDNPIADLPAILAQDRFLIRQAAEPDNPNIFFGTGSYRLKATSREGTRLEANDDSWQGRPFADTIEILSNRSPRDQLQDLAAGHADLIEIPPTEIRQARQQHLAILESPPVTLLALEIHATTLSPQLRAAVALAVDRVTLQQVIFQKQGEVTASLLPGALSGYSFLFATNRDLAQALALRGGITPPPLTLAVDGSGPMQLAAERLALNLHDAGFQVRVVQTPHPDMLLRAIPLPQGSPSAVLDQLLRYFGNPAPTAAAEESATYKAERDFLDQHAVIPLLWLPRAWAAGSRIRDLRLTAEGLPDLANASLANAGAANAGQANAGQARSSGDKEAGAK